MQINSHTIRHYSTSAIISFLLLTGCQKQVEKESSEVRVSIYNSDFAKISIADNKGHFVVSGVIDHVERDGRIWALHMERGNYGYTAKAYGHEVKGNFQKKNTLLELSINMQ